MVDAALSPAAGLREDFSEDESQTEEEGEHSSSVLSESVTRGKLRPSASSLSSATRQHKRLREQHPDIKTRRTVRPQQQVLSRPTAAALFTACVQSQ